MNVTHTPHKRVYQADTLKGLAILSVLLLHSLGTERLHASVAWFHIWQAVPVLCVLLGYTGLQTRVHPASTYFRRRLLRLGPPFAVAWLVSAIIGLIRKDLTFGPLTLVGLLPAGGPGNYFITLLFEYVLILPILRWLYERDRLLGLLSTLAGSMAFELTAYVTGFDSYLYSSCVLRYAFAIGLGMWIASGHTTVPLALPSALYLGAFATGWTMPSVISLWQPQNFVGFGYASTLVEIGLKYLPGRKGMMSALGAASYHIFLVQILWFGQVRGLLGLYDWKLVAASLVVCPAVGIAF